MIELIFYFNIYLDKQSNNAWKQMPATYVARSVIFFA